MPNPGSQRVESRPYKPPRKKRALNIPRGSVSRGPSGVVGGLLRSRTKLAPFVGRKLTGGGAKALPTAQRKLPKRPDAPTTQPKGYAEPRSRAYNVARKRTKAKARRTY